MALPGGTRARRHRGGARLPRDGGGQLKLVESWIGAPFALPPALLRRWPELDEARWRRGGLPPRLGGWLLGAPSVAGIALGRTVWLDRETSLDPELLLHEVRHVQQFRSLPFFAVRYVWETLRRGYLANRFEVDAREFARMRLHGAQA